MIKIIYFFFQARLERCINDPLTDFCTRSGERAHIVNVQAGQTIGDTLGQGWACAIAVGQKVTKCLRRGRKATGHTHIHVRKLADHFA